MDLNRVFAALDAAGIRVRSMRTKSNRLEELFVRLTGDDKAGGAAAGAGGMNATLPRRCRAPRNLVALGTIARREVTRILRIWGQTLVPPAITMTLYFLIFGSLIGSRIGEMDGISYMDFIVPGLVMMAVIQNGYGNISSSFFGAKFGRHVEELLVSPMPNWVILGGYVAGARAARADGRRDRAGASRCCSPRCACRIRWSPSPRCCWARRSSRSPASSTRCTRRSSTTSRSCRPSS